MVLRGSTDNLNHSSGGRPLKSHVSTAAATRRKSLVSKKNSAFAS